MADTAPGVSKKQIDRSGKVLRSAARNLVDDPDRDWSQDRMLAVTRAIAVVEEFRACHAKPLARVNAGLRYYVKKAGMAQPDITQRLKRFSTIVSKLDREGTMALSKMEDIGGVRAVLQSQEQVDAIRGELEQQKRWEIRRVRDYISNPKSDGYRAIHIVVEREGCYVEIQLRTPWQDTWAQSVEKETRRLQAGLKFGTGPDDLREYYRLVSELFAMRERNEDPNPGFMEQLAKQFEAVRDYFPERE